MIILPETTHLNNLSLLRQGIQDKLAAIHIHHKMTSLKALSKGVFTLTSVRADAARRKK